MKVFWLIVGAIVVYSFGHSAGRNSVLSHTDEPEVPVED